MGKKIGNQKPTQAVILNTKNSLYKKAVTLYENTGRKAQTWQVNLLKAILSRNKDGLWSHTKFGYSLPRRNGKNEIAAIRELYGLIEGEEILHTAHRTTTSHAAWERLLKMVETLELPYSSLKAIGREKIELENGGRVEFRTRTSTGGLGEGFDLLIIDEAQEYTTDQETALKYVVTDSKNPQTIFCGTPPTPISSGTVFNDLRKMVLAGSKRNAGWAEWAVEEETDPWDKKAWYKTNPSLGTIFTERSIEDEIGTDHVDFNIQRLGLWIKYNQKSAISQTEWDSLKIGKMPQLTGKLFAGIKYGKDGANVALSIAVKTEDQDVFVECVDCQSVRNGNAWIIHFLKHADVKSIVIDGASGQGLLANELKLNGVKGVLLPTVKEIINANAAFEQAVFKKTIRHNGQPSLSQVVTNCEKRSIGSSGGFGYSSQYDDYDIALMESVILAHWICNEDKPAIKQKIRY